VIRIYDLNRRLADVEMIDGRMRVVSYDGNWVERSLESVRRCYSPRKGPLLTDQEFYDVLPTRLRGQVRAVYVKG
jgi:hypothetical protein